ncbi:MAG TPA: bifunctional riboflavin kinase/FAD synthetase [bacterium]|nr:bifunctional riboflavin kinase/FAD synthetase [bacterium]HMW32784.1 bifunctional riboflavin kinase/FAD synthetase [bacterium]HMW35714.1 bifunctional riboflavin kinase/FAD synthetase [bacterium]HMZ05301.1 bifunctional riboflavin kinase/FAD synthetase [bacterium]HNB09564.1 bifunctional riboflavin kinase/FAD synthetase [bacterium]
MQILQGFDAINPNRPSVFTMGTFDGVHRGHQAVIKKLVEDAQALKARSVILTFDPHPQAVVNPEKAKSIHILTTIHEKQDIFAKLGVDALLIVKFDRSLMEKTGQEFVDQFLIQRAGMKKLLLGYDHAFGKNRSGTFESLQPMAVEMNFIIEKLPAFDFDRIVVNSTMIRNMLKDGDVSTANDLLGRRYIVEGTVQYGAGRGRTIGFPTANIQPTHMQKLIPMPGVYACRVNVDGSSFPAVTNIGQRPTFDTSLQTVIEAHILDFDRDLYDRSVGLEFIYRIRDERKFSSREELIWQIRQDIRHAREQGF